MKELKNKVVCIANTAQYNTNTKQIDACICKFNFSFKCKGGGVAPWGDNTIGNWHTGVWDGMGMYELCWEGGVLQTADLGLSIFKVHYYIHRIIEGFGKSLILRHRSIGSSEWILVSLVSGLCLSPLQFNEKSKARHTTAHGYYAMILVVRLYSTFIKLYCLGLPLH